MAAAEMLYMANPTLSSYRGMPGIVGPYCCGVFQGMSESVVSQPPARMAVTQHARIKTHRPKRERCEIAFVCAIWCPELVSHQDIALFHRHLRPVLEDVGDNLILVLLDLRDPDLRHEDIRLALFLADD